MEPIESTVNDVCLYVCRLPSTPKGIWKRLRIALTRQEVDEFKRMVMNDGAEHTEFIYAIRGLPIVIEEHPGNPLILMERP